MKSAKTIAEQVTDKYKNRRQYPVGKAQGDVLVALGIDPKSLNGHGHAQQIFEALGIVVSSRREGRETVPVVKKIGGGSARNSHGDYDVWNSAADNVDLSAIKKWFA